MSAGRCIKNGLNHKTIEDKQSKIVRDTLINVIAAFKTKYNPL